MLPVMNIFLFFRRSYFDLLHFIYKYSPVSFFEMKKPLTISDPTNEYIQKNTQKFHGVFVSYDSGEKSPNNEGRSPELFDYNSNIEKIVYIKKEFFDTLADPENPLENLWKKRILIENTPRGNIYMYYDIFKQGFVYYSDQTGVPYRILSAVAMKYVVVFRCVDFFLDETSMPHGKISPLVKIFVEDDDEERRNKKAKMENLQMNLKDAPFAKFKTYSKNVPKMENIMKKPIVGFWSRLLWNPWSQWIQHFFHIKNPDAVPVLENLPAPVKKDKIINKFIFLGHTKNFNPLQIPIKTKSVMPGLSTKYDAMFSKVQKISYKDFKENQGSL